MAHHQCLGSSSSHKSTTAASLFTLDKHMIKQRVPFRISEQQHLTKLFTTWISENLGAISIVEDSGPKEICSYFYHLGTSYLFAICSN